MFSRSWLALPLAAAALFASTSSAQTCTSYGVDYQDGGSYFLNSGSNTEFTFVSQFTGCTNSTADTYLVLPSGDQLTCSVIATYPSDTSFVSTCPIEQSQMSSGEYIILLFNNPYDSDNFAYERQITLTVAPQVTVSVTPTVYLNKTVTATENITTESTVYQTRNVTNSNIITVGGSTITVTTTPSGTATTTSLHTVDVTRKSWATTVTTTTDWITPQCTVPARQQQGDPFCTYANPKTGRVSRRQGGKRAAALDNAVAGARFAGIHEVRHVVEKRVIVKRAPQSSTVTTTLTSPVVTSTNTFTAATSTLTDVVFTTVVITKTLSPSTVHESNYHVTVTAAQPTITAFSVTTSTDYVVTTVTGTHTVVEISQPTSFKWGCIAQGGHFGGGLLGWS